MGDLFCLRYTPTFTLISRKKQKADLGGDWCSGHCHSGDGGCGLIKVALFVVMVMLVLPRAAVVMVGRLVCVLVVVINMLMLVLVMIMVVIEMVIFLC